jgi:hypothetical protein
MPSATVSQQMPVPSAEVFGLLHDYGRRLEWDTLLKEARLTRGNTEAGVGATSLCVGKPFFGIFAIETRYVTFDPPNIAAVTLINSPPLFAAFAASIRHEDNAGGSTVTYKLRFTAKPRAISRIIEPIMLKALKAETAKRLQALADFLGRGNVA